VVIYTVFEIRFIKANNNLSALFRIIIMFCVPFAKFYAKIIENGIKIFKYICFDLFEDWKESYRIF